MQSYVLTYLGLKERKRKGPFKRATLCSDLLRLKIKRKGPFKCAKLCSDLLKLK